MTKRAISLFSLVCQLLIASNLLCLAQDSELKQARRVNKGREELTAVDANELIDCMQDLGADDYQVRWKAIDEIEKLGLKARPAVPALLQHYKNNKHDADKTLYALSRLGDAAPEALPVLLSELDVALKDPSKYGQGASKAPILIEGFSKMHQNAQIVAQLRQALSHPNSVIRYDAAHALGCGGKAAAVAIADLERLYGDHEYVGLYVYSYGKDVAAAAQSAVEKLTAH